MAKDAVIIALKERLTLEKRWLDMAIIDRDAATAEVARNTEIIAACESAIYQLEATIALRHEAELKGPT